MKKYFIIVLLMLLSTSVSAKKFIVRDDLGIVKQYEIDQTFLDRFVVFIREYADYESRPFLSDIYHELQNGRNDIIYYYDSNIISGLEMKNWNSLTPKDVAKMKGNASTLDAIFNTKKQRFYKALDSLKYFK